MGPKPADDCADHDLFRTEVLNLINQCHELVRLAALVDWQACEAEWGPEFVSTTGRPALPTRLMAALLYLKHVYALSDEDVCEGWRENPYFQHFSGERYFQHELPCDPSSLVRWRQRIGEAGCEWLLAHSIEAARKGGLIKRQSLDHVVLDTTVQPKAIAHPTDSRLLNRAREQLVAAAQGAGIELRQSYARVGQAAEHQAGRYAHAKQYRRMQREIRRLRTWLGRVVRDVQRNASGIGPELKAKPGNPYDFHTVGSQLQQVEILTGQVPKIVLVDRGYRGAQTPEGMRLLISHTRRLPNRLKKLLKRRQVEEPMIGHMKADGLLAKSWLKGATGDALHAIFCGA
jgi:transposase, IS5 family